MNNLLTFLRSPIGIIKSGLFVQKEHNHAKRIRSKYNRSQLPTVDILDLFPDLDVQLDYYSFLKGTALISDMILLKSLAKTFNDCNYLEIGSWRGESAANVSKETLTSTALTLGEEQMRALNFGEAFISVHGIFSKNIDNLNTIHVNTHVYDFGVLNKKFDLIFIDGDHSYEGVLNDTKKSYKVLKDKKSVIVWHDYGNSTEDVRPSVFEAILDGIPKEKHKNLYHVSNTMCAIYMEDLQAETSFTKFPSYPNKKFEIRVKAKRL